jgi:4-hydroxythreonine-4-phosphate dehydrogenase
VKIVFSIGDINGIGAEIILKSYAAIRNGKDSFVVIGSHKVMEFYAHKCKLKLPMRKIERIEETSPKSLDVINIESHPHLDTGKITAHAGHLAMKSIEAAAKLCLEKKADALVTAPISKEAIQKGGYNFQGHTDYLAFLTKTHNEMMILADAKTKLRVALLTVHLPLAQVAKQLTAASVLDKIESFHAALQNDFGVTSPRIAMLGLNPHASDNGVMGKEENNIFKPAIDAAVAKHISAQGCFPADAFFGTKRFKDFDGVLAAYHDQGLVPFKMLAFKTGVNVTAGLPIVRTSPDHGTAFDIAGLGKADPSSFTAAVKMALAIADARRKLSR